MWIVMWTLLVTVPTECPDFEPDPYTGEYPMVHCLVYHTKTIERKMEKRFDSKEEAEKFIADAPDNIRPLMKIEETK